MKPLRHDVGGAHFPCIIPRVKSNYAEQRERIRSNLAPSDRYNLNTRVYVCIASVDESKLVEDFHRSDHRGGANGGLDCRCCCCCCLETADGRRAGVGGCDTTLPPHPDIRNAAPLASSSMNGARSLTATSNTSHTHCLPLSGNMLRVARVAVSFAHTFAVNDVSLQYRDYTLFTVVDIPFFSTERRYAKE